jgi:hypothetical protein
MRIPEDGEDIRRSRAGGPAASGVDADQGASTYQVRIVYTEPEFQRRTPGAPEKYSFTYFGIAARSPQEAVQMALQDFRETAWRSRVSWRRCVERVMVLSGSGIPLERPGDDLPREI